MENMTRQMRRKTTDPKLTKLKGGHLPPFQVAHEIHLESRSGNRRAGRSHVARREEQNPASNTTPWNPQVASLPAHLAEMARFSLATGLRQSNVTGLEWSQVDLTRRVAWIHHDQIKNRKALSIPLNAEAVLVLRRQTGKHPVRVFTYRGRPVGWVNTKAWKAALRRAGIEQFRWHDLRHTWASWHVQAGTPLHVLQELGGWESVEMVRRYAHLSSEHLADYVDRLSGLRLVEGGRGYDLATLPETKRG